jgi:nitrogen-specific signal transduction histidine kinase
LERQKSGTGLGLFIVRTLVTRLHGKITVRDREGHSGTVFEVQLPARASGGDVDRDESPSESTRLAPPQITRTRS